MLWSDDQQNQPPEDTRRTQAMLHRAILLIALAAAVAMTLTTWRG